MKTIIFQIEGGIGKVIMATAVIAEIKKQTPDADIIVVSAYPEVLVNNPNVYRNIAFSQRAYFYKEYVENKDVEFFLHNPYFETSHLLERNHLIRTWLNMYGYHYNGTMPELFLSNREKEFYLKSLQLTKPLMLIQTNGGGDNNIAYSWARDLPVSTAQKVVDAFKDEYDIFHIRKPNQISLNGAKQLTATFREIAAIIEVSKKRCFIDSFAQHAAAAMKKKSTVCWIANSPQVFGYDIHVNIVANEFTAVPDLRDSYVSKFNAAGNPLEFPYNHETEIFNPDKIIESIKKQ